MEHLLDEAKVIVTPKTAKGTLQELEVLLEKLNNESLFNFDTEMSISK